MTVLATRIAQPAFGLRSLLTRLGRGIDALVSARAAREVPEWRLQQVQHEIEHYRDLIETRPDKRRSR